jgi:Lon protease-like protein
MKSEHGFVVALISSGKEVDDLPEIYSTGTYVEITDWKTLDNTLLAITVTGIRRMNILSSSSSENGLMIAQTEYFNEPSISNHKIELENKYNSLVETLQQLSQHPFVSQKYSDVDYSSSIDVCYRLSELLPASNTLKQDLLETVDIHSYIEKLEAIIKTIGG